MPLGKTLRQRRIFSRGRALIAMLDHHHALATDGLRPMARTFARCDLDAIILTPGSLELVAEDVGNLALILRLNLNWPNLPVVATVQSALESGAEAVALSVDIKSPQSLDTFGRVTEEARRAGLPLLAEMTGNDFRALTSVGAEFGADMILFRADACDAPAIRQSSKFAAHPVLVSPTPSEPLALVRSTQVLLDCGIQGIVVGARPEATLGTLRSLVHDGVHLRENLRLVE